MSKTIYIHNNERYDGYELCADGLVDRWMRQEGLTEKQSRALAIDAFQAWNHYLGDVLHEALKKNDLAKIKKILLYDGDSLIRSKMKGYWPKEKEDIK